MCNFANDGDDKVPEAEQAGVGVHKAERDDL
jgi:hypothetical protein